MHTHAHARTRTEAGSESKRDPLSRVSTPLAVAVVPSPVREAELLWTPTSSSLGPLKKQRECRFVRNEGPPGTMPPSDVCAQSEAHLEWNSSSRRGAVGTAGWTTRQIVPFRKGTSSPSSLVGVCVAPPGLEDPTERTYRRCPLSGPARSFRDSPVESGDVEISVSRVGQGLPRWLRRRPSRAHAGDTGFTPGPGRSHTLQSHEAHRPRGWNPCPRSRPRRAPSPPAPGSHRSPRAPVPTLPERNHSHEKPRHATAERPPPPRRENGSHGHEDAAHPHRNQRHPTI